MDSTSFFVNFFFFFGFQNPHVTIQAVPSMTEQQKLSDDEQERLETIVQANSETTLELKQTILEESVIQNEESPPEELITAAELLATAEINYHWALRYNSMRQTTPPGINLQKMPLYTEAYDLSTSFVYVRRLNLVYGLLTGTNEHQCSFLGIGNLQYGLYTV